MMYVPPAFQEDRTHVLRAAVDDIVFGALVTQSDDGPVVTHVPMMLTGPDDAMVLEAHGGSWSRPARKIWDRLVRREAAMTGEEPSQVSLRIAQRTSVALHGENARAILKRLVTSSTTNMKSGWDDAAEAEDLCQ